MTALQKKMLVSGTRHGWTVQQRNEFRNIAHSLQERLERHELPIVVHGGAVGVDEQAHVMLTALGWPDIEIWPSTLPRSYQMHTDWHAGTQVVRHWPMPPLDRDSFMAEECDGGLFFPAELSEKLRSGTWATYRRVNKLNKPWLIVYPTGSSSSRRPITLPTIRSPLAWAP